MQDMWVIEEWNKGEDEYVRFLELVSTKSFLEGEKKNEIFQTRTE